MTAQKIFIAVLICVFALRTDLPHFWATSTSGEAILATNNDSDEHEYPADDSEFPEADEWEVVESESKAGDESFCASDLAVHVKLGGASLFRESNSLQHFSLGSFDILDRLRL